MFTVEKINERLLAVYPTTKGFAFLITEGTSRIIY